MNSVKPSDIHISDLAVGQGKGTLSLIDDSSGDLNKTVIKEISASEDANKVHIVGSASAHIANNLMKVRVLRHPNGGYTVPYTKINDANFKTLVIDKTTTHHFTNYGGSFVPHIIPNFVMMNHLGGVRLTEVSTSTVTYNGFKETNLSTLDFSIDWAAIGAKWRITIPSSPRETIGVRANLF